jgi:hypothetical protein
MTRFILAFSICWLYTAVSATPPVFRNPGLPALEKIEISDHLDLKTGYVNTRITLSQKEEGGKQFYYMSADEGGIFLNECKLNHDDLTPVWEKRTDERTHLILESYERRGDSVYFFSREKEIDKKLIDKNRNSYSRYAYLVSFRGFPFRDGGRLSFYSYMAEYGSALPMTLKFVGREGVSVKGGTFDCYKLALSVAGWVSLFASGTYYFYYAAEPPHRFIKYEELGDDGHWYANELLNILP